MTSKKQKSFNIHNSSWLLPLHAYVSFAMTGSMVFVHYVQYPLFRFIEPDRFIEFHNNHIVRITPFVGALMFIELLTALFLFLKNNSPLWVTNFILVLSTWIMTGFWQGPMHVKLGNVYDPQLVEHLISTNNFRLVAWTIHSLLVLAALIQMSKIKKNTRLLS